MSLADRLFGRSPGVKLDLAAVQARLTAAIRHVGEPDVELSRARFADGCRDLGMSPILSEEFDAVGPRLDGEGHRRLAVLIAVLDLEQFRTAIPKLSVGRSAAELAATFAGLVRDTALLTIDVLGQSELRVEELARRLFSVLGANVAGESAEDSKKKLHRLDYGRLLAEAEQAKLAATERSEQLKKLQDEHELRRTRRGKM